MATITVDSAYSQVEKLIYDTCWKFQKSYGGDFEELRSRANESFMDAWVRFNESKKMKFSTWVRYYIWCDLLTDLTKYIKLSEKETVDFQTLLEKEGPLDQRTRFQEVLEDLTEDGLMVVRLVFDPPEILESVIEKKGGAPRNFRSSIREYLEDFGWDSPRVRDAFNELKDVLFS